MKPYFLFEGVALYVAGIHILDVLYKRVRELNVVTVSNRLATDTVTHRNKVVDVISVDVYTGEIFYNPTKSVILAIGGCQGLYSLNSGTAELTCDGVSIALRGGAGI